MLVGLDVLALAGGWFGAFSLLGMDGAVAPMTATAFALLGAVVGLVAIAANGLWRARVCAIRSMEIRLLAHAAIISAISLIVLYEVAELEVSTLATLIAAVCSFFALVAVRGLFRWMTRAQRRRGRLAYAVVLIGWNPEAADLLAVLRDHVESGFRVVGIVSDAPPPDDVGMPWLGLADHAARAVRGAGATGALVVGSALPPDQLNRVTRHLLGAQVHVHMSSGLRGIAHDRIRVHPVAYEPLLYVERSEFTRIELLVKRTIDVALASIVGVVVLPMLALAALAIKLDDGGPLLFAQRRVGKDGHQFTLYKLRTMVPSAEDELASLREFNGRAGPLFKMARDPRVTRVGRVLRATSLDELPQLFNVLLGTMSLVGPRPALPREVETFDEQLRSRANVVPGITGLWQVEARDDPSFARYRRLDMYYVDNWSVGLDFSILLSTVGVVTARACRYLRTLVRVGRRSHSVSDHVLD